MDDLHGKILSFYIDLDFFESTRMKESQPAYSIEIQALKHACQHRTHCFIYDIVGFCQVDSLNPTNTRTLNHLGCSTWNSPLQFLLHHWSE